MSFQKYKDWTTTMRDARMRSVPANLPSNVREYFNKSLNDADMTARSGRANSSSAQYGRYRNPHGSSYQAENGGMRDRRTQAHIHVGRNNPHPFRIHFPFQTGDRLSTYMVWLPVEKHIGDTTPSLPKIRNDPNNSRALPLGKTYGHCSIDNIGTPMSTYQDEIARMPLLKNRVMVDHFPDLTKGKLLISTAN